MIDDVLQRYNLTNAMVAPLGNGLINHTWKVTAAGKNYVLQRINSTVFHRPQDIAFNIRLIGDHLQTAHPGYLFTRPIATLTGEELISVDDNDYRLFAFIEGSHTIEVVSTSEQAYEAAAQFGKFTQFLSGFNASVLQITIPHFHNLGLRYEQFLNAAKAGNASRIAEAKNLIGALLEKKGIATTFSALQSDKVFKKRVTHHDTKISNVLFDKNNKGLCVIDLDTVMPGYFISDVGDMLRTYLSPTNEEDAELEMIGIRDDFYIAIIQGYMSAMGDELTDAERNHFFYAGEAMIYMQALRFLTDYLNNDSYYGATYENHNLARAKNQSMLLRRFQEKKHLLQKTA